MRKMRVLSTATLLAMVLSAATVLCFGYVGFGYLNRVAEKVCERSAEQACPDGAIVEYSGNAFASSCKAICSDASAPAADSTDQS